MESIIKRLMENHRLEESSRPTPTREKLESEIAAEAKKLMTDYNYGFTEDELDDYLFIEVTDSKDCQDDACYKIEVRAEVTYEGLESLCDVLNPIVAKYDKDAYFEPVTSGIIVSYVRK